MLSIDKYKEFNEYRDGYIGVISTMSNEVAKCISESPANELLDLMTARTSEFNALDPQIQYLCKRALHKAFTEHVLQMKQGKLINMNLIWDTSLYAAQLVHAITQEDFILSAVGSYSLVIMYNATSKGD